MKWPKRGLRAAAVTSNPYQSPQPVPEESPAVPRPARDGWKLVSIAVLVVALAWFVPLLNFVAFAFLGWATSRGWPDAARIGARAMPLVMGVILGVLVLTGLPWLHFATAEVHRWSGHAIVVLVYTCTAYALGVLIHQQLVRYPVLAVAQSLGLLISLAVLLLASMTGYLDDDPRTSAAAHETQGRFVGLHMVVLPTAFAISLVVWHRAFRPEPSSRGAV